MQMGPQPIGTSGADRDQAAQSTALRAPTGLEKPAAWFGARRAWSRRFWAMLAGALATAALPPVHAVPLLIPALCVLLWMLLGQKGWLSALTLGFWFGFGHHVAGLYWLAWPLTLDLARFGWMIPFAVFGLSALFGIFIAVSTLLTHLFRLHGLGQILALAAVWTALEWIRGNYIFAGFPWNLIGTTWTALDPMTQTASVWGVYGLTLVTLLIAGLPAVWGHEGAERRARIFVTAAAGAMLAGLAVFGFVRLSGEGPGVADGVRLRLVQGHVPQSEKWAPGTRDKFFNIYLRLSGAAGFDRITHVIWPETAIRYRFETGLRHLRLSGARAARLRAVIPARGALIAGAVRDDGVRAWNSVQIVTRERGLVGTYDKHHLVPFGEYVPARGLLRSLGISRIAHGRFDFSFGNGPRTMTAPGLPGFSPLVCYEAIFPHEVVGPKRPEFLLNVTNDAWFGTTSGPYQHLAAARLRAVEQGLPLVRAANTGISVVTDAYGRVVARLGLGKRGIVDSGLPKPLANPTTYARIGDWVVLPLLLLVLILARFLSLRSRR